MASEELIVLVHGLDGQVEDFTCLLETLNGSKAVSCGHALVYAPRVNTGRTFDGVAAGGMRLADDLRAFIASHGTLKRISMLGFSLGGLYVRYATAVLYDDDTGNIGGLEPARLVLMATPNLGVRGYGVYRFIPDFLCHIAPVFYGQTGRDILLIDDEQLLLRMTLDDSSDGGGDSRLLFISALKVFRQRYLYANTRGDFFVNYGTSALEPRAQRLGTSSIDTGAGTAKESEEITERVVENDNKGERDEIDRVEDELGCRLLYCEEYRESDVAPDTLSITSAASETTIKMAHTMAMRLRAVGWRLIAVQFGLNMPVAHDRIINLSRTARSTRVNAAGRRVVHHIADVLLDGVGVGEQVHERTFSRVA